MNPIADPCADLTGGFLLMDVSANSDINYESFRTVSCVPSGLTKAAELMPCLISVSDLSSSQLEQLVDIFRQQATGEHAFAICAWIECDLKIGDLAEHLALFLCGLGPDGAKVLWRFFDPRAFATSMSVLSQEQRQSLLGPIKSWRFTWCRNWWLISHKPCKPCPLSDSHTGWPTAQQWPLVQGTRVIHRTVNQLDNEMKLRAEQCVQILNAAITSFEDAIRLNLHNENDQAEFVYLCVKYGPAYRRHPKLARAWDELTQGNVGWIDVRSQLLAADFDHLKVVIYS